jgi:MFS family permease
LKYPLWIVFARTLDRFGKGLRTASRDALLSQNAKPETKARVFGFHRAMDTVGAAIGPALALLFLYLYPNQFTNLFYIAFIPGIIAVLLVSLLKEKKQPTSTLGKGNFFSFFRYWHIATPEYKKLVTALLLFTLFNSSDFFLLLRTSELTANEALHLGNVTLTGAQIPIAAYIFYNLVYATTSYPLGSLADRIGIKTVFLCGLTLFAITYGGFAFDPSIEMIFLLFGVYGVFAAATEGITKAWITNIAHGSDTATAVGFYTSGQSVCTLLASSIAGGLWLSLGSSFIFAATAVMSVVVLFFVLVAVRAPNK